MGVPEIYHAAETWLQSGPLSGGLRRAVVGVLVVAGAFVLAQALRMGLDPLRSGTLRRTSDLCHRESRRLRDPGLRSHRRCLHDGGQPAVPGGIRRGDGVGVGLGLQGVVKEFVSGLVLIFDPTIQVGDFIEVDDDIRGEVVEIGPRATRLRTNDNLNVVIPNSSLTQTRVINWTYNEQSRRIHVPFSVAEESDKAVVRDVVLAAAKALPFTLPDDYVRKAQVWLVGFGADGLDFELVVWPTLESRGTTAPFTRPTPGRSTRRCRGRAWRTPTRRWTSACRASSAERGRRLPRAAPGGRPPGPDSQPRFAPAPNDAAAAVYDEAERQRLQREVEAPRARQARDSDVSKDPAP